MMVHGWTWLAINDGAWVDLAINDGAWVDLAINDGAWVDLAINDGAWVDLAGYKCLHQLQKTVSALLLCRTGNLMAQFAPFNRLPTLCSALIAYGSGTSSYN